MIALLAALSLAPAPAAAPAQVIIATARGEATLAIALDRLAGPGLSGTGLARALNGRLRTTEPWVEINLGPQTFRFLVGVPVLAVDGRLEPLAGHAFRTRDSLFLPLQFVTEILPTVLAERYAWDRARGRLVEGRAGSRQLPASPGRRLPNGLLAGHVVTVDPGHGGVDPGNPGVYFPRGVSEKDVTLAIGLQLRDELRRRGVGVVMTRTTDTLIALEDRGRFCANDCDLFLSVHVNSLPRRRGNAATRGFETYFLSEAKTEDASRVEAMENEAVRFEATAARERDGGNLDYILRDLQLNEYLRESARAAELVQEHLGPVHPGDDRGVKQAGFMVLTTARRPAILVELGYSTNPQDARLLTGRKSQVTLAYALADAVVAYLREYERKTGGPAGGSGR